MSFQLDLLVLGKLFDSGFGPWRESLTPRLMTFHRNLCSILGGLAAAHAGHKSRLLLTNGVVEYMGKLLVRENLQLLVMHSGNMARGRLKYP